MNKKYTSNNKTDDWVHDAFHKNLAIEIKRVMLECDKQGIFLNKKLATALVAEKSKRGKMTISEIKNYIRQIRNLTGEIK